MNVLERLVVAGSDASACGGDEQLSVAAALVVVRGRVVEEVVTRQEGSEGKVHEEYDTPRTPKALGDWVMVQEAVNDDAPVAFVLSQSLAAKQQQDEEARQAEELRECEKLFARATGPSSPASSSAPARATLPLREEEEADILLHVTSCCL